MNAEKHVILVTGGSGLVGQGIKSILDTDKKENEEFVFLSSKDADLTKREDTLNVFNKYKPTHVIHLAAYVGGLYKHLKHNLDFWKINTAINENILSISHELGVKKCVSCLSTCIFPDKTNYPIDESMVHNGVPHESNFGYAFAKRMIDVMNKAYFDQYGIKYTSVIPTNIFGPFDNFNLKDSHVIAGLIHKCYIAKKTNGVFVVNGNGIALRQFIFSKDLARLILWAVREYDDIEPIIFSVGPHEEISIRDAVDAIAEALDFKGEIYYDKSKSDGQIKKTVSIKKLQGYLPNFKFVPFKQAIKETCNWFVENFETARK